MQNTGHARVEQILNIWKNEPSIAENIVGVFTIPSRFAQLCELSAGIHPVIRRMLQAMGITALYSHQQLSLEMTGQGKNIVVVTGTASGKTLCYNLPVLQDLYDNPKSRALYLFPTKALAQDQYQNLLNWLKELDGGVSVTAGVYDGDTPANARQAVRGKARIVLSNPDMLHNGILPHHTIWAEFFKHLCFIVIDEMHTYRGVFGSHLANLFRRLKRVAAFYGSYPQFILTSATIANPQQLAERLIEEKTTLVNEDGSPSGEKHFVLYNPPVINPELGLRASPIQEGVRLAGDLLSYGIQSIIFSRTRRSVELFLTYLRQGNPEMSEAIQGYRSGYLPLERRKIEKGLRDGQIRSVIATNALELGIDIGSMSASMLIGYPGTIASTRQQSGRAGRTQENSLSMLVASADPLDQFIIQHPDYLFGKPPEQALIDPDNLLILLQHLRCAAFELPFKEGEAFGSLDKQLLHDLLDALSDAGEIHHSGKRYFWMADQYPSSQVSLRSSSPEGVVLQTEEDGLAQAIGIVDQASAHWMVHPDAVYLHAGQTYLVESLDLENHQAMLKRQDLDYYTEPMRKTTVELIEELARERLPGAEKYFGEIKVTTQVVGFRKVRWYTYENIGEGIVDLPPTELMTTGYWLALGDPIVDQLREAGLWSADANNYGPGWDRLRLIVRQRDNFTCQMCGAPELGRTHHVHHKIPFRTFQSIQEANRLDNLITLCPNCHRKAETNLRIRSGLAGLSYLLQHLSPLFLMCDIGDIGAFLDPQSNLADGKPIALIYDEIPAGIGLSKKLFEVDRQLLSEALLLVRNCPCQDGCPSCVGPAGENGVGGKEETLAILQALNET